MRIVKQRSLCLLAAMALLAASAQVSTAAGVVLKNEMKLDIKAILCVDDTGKTRQVTGALKAGKTANVSPGKFPEHECNRIAVHTESGQAWQYYHEPEPGSSKEMVFSTDKANPGEKESYPSLLMESSGDFYVSPAGVPFSILTQVMQFGMDEARWKELAAPGFAASKTPGAHAVSFADVSWTLAGNGIRFAELLPGKQLAESLTMTSTFSNPTVMVMFEGLKTAGASPWLVASKDGETALSREGKKMAPKAELVMDAKEDSDARRWEAVDKKLETASESAGPESVRVILGSEALIFELVLNLESGRASLTITRKAGAAFS